MSDVFYVPFADEFPTEIHIVCIGAAEAIVLGFQHYLVMLGTTVIISTIIVPYMGGGNVSNFTLQLLLPLPSI